MRLLVLQRGALKDADISRRCREYCKRFQRFGKLEIRESKQPQWPASGYRILCDEHGDTYTSEQLAAQLARWSMHHGPITLAIGDAHGHDQEFAAAAHQCLRLSTLTLPHRLAHLLLVEQLYRAACIQAGHPYHHA